MKVSLRWLAEFIDLPTEDPATIADILARLGHEVEGYEELLPGFTGVVVGRVEEIRPHPDADKIRVCTVSTGGDTTAEIICGAWNFDTGAVVAVAEPGAVLGDDFVITRRKIRGVVSNGMICSAHELGLGEDREGILVLDPDLPLGSDLTGHVELPDVVLDLSITPNRPDVMSMIGVARELAAFWHLKVRVPAPSVGGQHSASGVPVTIDDPVGCRRFVARPVRGVTIGSSPLWMQERLRKGGVRSINNVVDVSNYVMLELGQPTHAFDLDTLREGRIVVRRAKAGETLVTLDDVRRDLGRDDLLVADGVEPSSLAGTMGGADSEVSATTRNVLVEAASWDPGTILHMSRRHGLRSEASARFERNVDPNLPRLAADRVTELIVATGGGDADAKVTDVYPNPVEPWTVALPVTEVERVLGKAFPAAELREMLARLDMTAEGEDTLTVQVPTYRPDVTRPIDLIEEVARLHGYDNFPSTLPAGHGGGLSTEQRRTRKLRRVLVGAGFSEAQTFSFHGRDALAWLDLPAGDVRRNAIEVYNPLREEESLLRTTLLPGLLSAARFNVGHGNRDVALFEIGKVFFSDDLPERGVVPHQPDQVGFVAVGRLTPPGLDGTARPVDVYTGTGVWRLVARHMALGDAEVRAAAVPALHPGRAAEVFVDGGVAGFVGELHPAVARAFDLPGRVVVGEFDLSAVVAHPGLWQFEEPSLYPPVEFDLSFEIDAALPGARLVTLSREAAGRLLEKVEIFDEFHGGSMAEGRRAVALRYTLRAADRTLTNEEAAPVRQEIIDAVATAGGTLRGAAR